MSAAVAGAKAQCSLAVQLAAVIIGDESQKEPEEEPEPTGEAPKRPARDFGCAPDEHT